MELKGKPSFQNHCLKGIIVFWIAEWFLLFQNPESWIHSSTTGRGVWCVVWKRVGGWGFWGEGGIGGWHTTESRKHLAGSPLRVKVWTHKRTAQDMCRSGPWVAASPGGPGLGIGFPQEHYLPITSLGPLPCVLLSTGRPEGFYCGFFSLLEVRQLNKKERVKKQRCPMCSNSCVTCVSASRACQFIWQFLIC